MVDILYMTGKFHRIPHSFQACQAPFDLKRPLARQWLRRGRWPKALPEMDKTPVEMDKTPAEMDKTPVEMDKTGL